MNQKTNMSRNLKKLDNWAPKDSFQDQLYNNYQMKWNAHLKRRVIADIRSRSGSITKFVRKTSKTKSVYEVSLESGKVNVVYDKYLKTLTDALPPNSKGEA